MKKVLLLSTGGTIASVTSEEGFVPRLSAEDLVNIVPELKSVCHIECKSIMNLDSSNMQPENWQIIAREVYAGLQDCDGIVVSHGTDTMAYTSSMLSFMLQKLHKPVVITGSQLPIGEAETDGKRNILNAFQLAASGYPGVFIVFDGVIIRGSRAVKLRTVSFNAFESVNAPRAGFFAENRLVMEHPGPPPEEGVCQLAESIESQVFLLKLIPGTRPEIIDTIVSIGYRGLVIESFGSGGLPYLGRDLLQAVDKALQAGLVVVVTTQCLYEGADLTVYDVGVKAAKAGAISAYDMTTEAAVTKLMWVLGQTRDQQEIRRMMETSYVGEITLS